jgi:hypothetical protein
MLMGKTSEHQDSHPKKDVKDFVLVGSNLIIPTLSYLQSGTVSINLHGVPSPTLLLKQASPAQRRVILLCQPQEEVGVGIEIHHWGD